MSKCHATGEKVEYTKDCMECHTMSCPMNTGFADYPIPDNVLSLKVSRKEEENENLIVAERIRKAN